MLPAELDEIRFHVCKLFSKHSLQVWQPPFIQHTFLAKKIYIFSSSFKFDASKNLSASQTASLHPTFTKKYFSCQNKNLHLLIFIWCFQKTSLQVWQPHFIHNSQIFFFGQKVHFLTKPNLHLLIFIWVSKTLSSKYSTNNWCFVPTKLLKNIWCLTSP